jgi:hypothetical protein
MMVVNGQLSLYPEIISQIALMKKKGLYVMVEEWKLIRMNMA